MHAVTMPFIPMPIATKVAAIPLSGAIWEAATPLPATPAARPWERQIVHAEPTQDHLIDHSRYTDICIPAATMMEMVRTHNSMAVKRGYLIFIIMIFLMFLDENFISTPPSDFHHCMVCRVDVRCNR